MPFRVSWHTLLEQLEDLPADATLVTPLSRKPFRITDMQEHRVLIEYREDAGTVPLQREQFETLYERVHDAPAGFVLDRLPPDAERSVQRTTRRNRMLKDDEDVLAALEDAGIDPEQVMGVDLAGKADSL